MLGGISRNLPAYQLGLGLCLGVNPGVFFTAEGEMLLGGRPPAAEQLAVRKPVFSIPRRCFSIRVHITLPANKPKPCKWREQQDLDFYRRTNQKYIDARLCKRYSNMSSSHTSTKTMNYLNALLSGAAIFPSIYWPRRRKYNSNRCLTVSVIYFISVMQQCRWPLAVTSWSG